MSLIDNILNIIITIINNSLLKLPHEISALPISKIQADIYNYSETFASAYGFTEHMLPIGLIMSLFGAIIVAEVALHLGWKGVKFFINFIRGSGG